MPKSITIKIKNDTPENTREYLEELKKIIEDDKTDPTALGQVLDRNDIWYALKEYYGTSNFYYG
tara:strand:+ start:1730 stop:1921 length:192 start_codon:yes stop_codon:yes gene_type:complete